MYLHWNSDYHSDMWHDIHMFGGYTGCSCYIQSTECYGCNFAYYYPTYVVSCPPNWRSTGHAAMLFLADGSTHPPSTNIGTTNQSTPLLRHLWLYGVGARRHLRWWLHDWLARQTLDVAEPCRLAWTGEKIKRIENHEDIFTSMSLLRSRICVCVCVLMLICKVITVVTVGLVHSLMCEIVGDRC